MNAVLRGRDTKSDSLREECGLTVFVLSKVQLINRMIYSISKGELLLGKGVFLIKI